MNSIQRLTTTAALLWRTSPPWKWTVIGSSVLTALVAINSMSSSGSRSHGGTGPTSGYMPPPPSDGVPIDPRSDSRLTAFQSVYDIAMAIKQPGRQCEKLADAFQKLNDSDKERGSAIPSRSKAIDDGGHCLDQINISNGHFNALSDAVTAADSNATPAAMQSAIDALGALDSFDASRSRYAAEAAAIDKARSYPGLLAASDGRTKAFQDALQAYDADQSGASALRLSAAFEQLTELDRGRLGDSQHRGLVTAEHVASAVREARSHFDLLPELLARTEGGASEPDIEQLLAAVAKIGSFDQSIATVDQKQLYDRAKAIVLPQAWSLLRKREATAAAKPSAASVLAVAEIYGVLKNEAAADQDPGHASLLASGKEAADRIAASNARLKALVDAGADWQSQGPNAGQSVVAPVRAITAFDEARFDAADREAWSVLSKAEAIMDGPSIGVTAASKDKVNILVEAKDGGAARVASALATRLGAAGFLVTDNAKEAALRVTVSVGGIDDPSTDTSGTFIMYSSTAHLNVSAIWAGDGSSLFSEQIDGTGRGNEPDNARVKALSAAVNAVVARFKSMAEK